MWTGLGHLLIRNHAGTMQAFLIVAALMVAGVIFGRAGRALILGCLGAVAGLFVGAILGMAATDPNSDTPSAAWLVVPTLVGAIGGLWAGARMSAGQFLGLRSHPAARGGREPQKLFEVRQKLMRAVAQSQRTSWGEGAAHRRASTPRPVPRSYSLLDPPIIWVVYALAAILLFRLAALFVQWQ